MNKPDIPAIQLNIMGGGTLWFVVDTGSNTNLISSGFPPLSEKQSGTHQGTGRQWFLGHLVSGATYKLRYTTDGNDFLDAFSSVDSTTIQAFNEYGMSISGILGTEFMIHHKAVIDFAGETNTLNERMEDKPAFHNISTERGHILSC